jgi:hypothetical protein
MNDPVRSTTIDDDLPFDTDLAQLFQGSLLPRRLDIQQLVDRYEPRARAGDKVDCARSPSSRRYLAASALGLGVCVLIGLSQMFAPPQSALAQVAAELQRVSSLRCSETMSNVAGVLRGPKRGTLYWAASGSYRDEQISNGKVVCVDIHPANEPGIFIFRWPLKAFRKEPPSQQRPFPVMVLEKLATLRGEADRDLGQSTIGQIEARGFEIAFRRLNPEAGPADKVRVWYNPTTMRPVRIEVELVSLLGISRFEDFVWNEPSDKWFDTTPPAGYEERTFKMPPTAEAVDSLVKAFRIYANYCGGRYPVGNMVNTEVVNAELYVKTGAMMLRSQGPRKKTGEKLPENVQDYFSAQNGFSEINLLHLFPVDLGYHGNTVGPSDQEEVLLRWKLESGDYEVIYGDLHSGTVSAQRLKELESK